MKQTVTVGERIAHLLNEKHMTQRELSSIINVTEVTVGRYVNDTREPKGSTLRDIASALEVSTDFLLNGITVLNKKDEKDISKKLNNILSEMENDGALMFDGEFLDMDEESRELLKSSLENTLRLAKKLAKEKYTPNKYKK